MGDYEQRNRGRTTVNKQPAGPRGGVLLKSRGTWTLSQRRCRFRVCKFASDSSAVVPARVLRLPTAVDDPAKFSANLSIARLGGTVPAVRDGPARARRARIA